MVLTQWFTVWCNVCMQLKAYLAQMTASEREAFATKCRTSLGHLKNVMYGYKPCATDLAVNIERESACQVRRQDLRPDWGSHWPELAAKYSATAEQGA